MVAIPMSKVAGPEVLNKENLLKGLLQHNYLPKQHDLQEELPPIFTSITFTPDAAKALLAIPPRAKEGYDVLPYRRTRHPNIPRMMGIPHPRAYAQLVFSLAEHWDTKLSGLCNSPNSEIEFSVFDDGRIIIQKYGHVDTDGEEKDKDPLFNFGKRYRIKTDIANFYHSVYSHSIPWALVGHKEAKKKKGPLHKGEWFNQIDWAITLCQRNETKGLPIGPGTSNIISEIILYRVDEKLREKKYAFSRFVDDYKSYSHTIEEAEKFLFHLSSALETYALTLNPKKTSTIELPLPQKERWITELNIILGTEGRKENKEEKDKISLRRAKVIIDKAIALNREYPESSALKYALSSIIDFGLQDEAKEYFEDTILRMSFYYPTLVPLIQRGIQQHAFFCRHLKTRLEWLFNQSLENSYSDNIVWCLYYLLKTHVLLDVKELQRAWAHEDPMVMLMVYMYAKTFKKDITFIKDWAVEKKKAAAVGDVTNYDLDKYWMVFYQLYRDKVAAAPYVDGEDNKVFAVLKKHKVTFIDEDNLDLLAYEKFLKALFKPVKQAASPPKNVQKSSKPKDV